MRVKIIFGIVIGLVILGVVYLFHDDKFYLEYWLQRQVDDLPLTEKIESSATADERIRYKFYFSPSVDLSIELDNKGNLTLKRHSWFADSKQVRVYDFKVDESEFSKIKTDFNEHWTESISKDADYNLGGVYYELELLEATPPGTETTVGFYNVTPDKPFLDLKNRMIQLVKSALKK